MRERSVYSTGASVGESGSIRAEQLVLVEVDRWTDGARLSPAYTHRLHVVDHAAAGAASDGHRARLETATITHVRVAQCTTSVYQHTASINQPGKTLLRSRSDRLH